MHILIWIINKTRLHNFSKAIKWTKKLLIIKKLSVMIVALLEPRIRKKSTNISKLENELESLVPGVSVAKPLFSGHRILNLSE